MTLKQLKAFISVAQTLSFAEASSRMFMSQPALSITIKNLEEELGGRLLVRTTRTTVLTPEGKALYDRARPILADWDLMEDEIQQRFQLERGTLSIACMPSFAASTLPQILMLFKEAHPNINIQVHDVIAEEAVDLVNAGKVELGITFDPKQAADTNQFKPLNEDQFVAVLPSTHILAKKNVVTWQDLLEYDFIALQKPSLIRKLIESTLEECGHSLCIAYDSHQISTIASMVSAGLGVSVVPSISTPQMELMKTKTVKIIDPEVKTTIGILTKRRDQLSVPAKALFDTITNFYL